MKTEERVHLKTLLRLTVHISLKMPALGVRFPAQ